MKKYLMILVALVCFGISVNAQNSYTVTVNTLKTYYYYDDADCYKQVGTSTAPGTSQVITVCAETSYEAVQKAIEECDRMCKRGYPKQEPKATYNGKSCWVKSTLEPSSTSVEDNNQSCN